MMSFEKRNLYFKGLLALGIGLILFAFAFDRVQNSLDPVEQSVEILTDWIHHQSEQLDALTNEPELKSVLDSLPLLYNYLDKKSKKHPHYLYVSNSDKQLVYWSTNRANPANISSIVNSNEKLVRINNGYYVAKTYQLNDTYQLIGLLPIYQYYPVENKFLKSGFFLKSSTLQKTMVTRRDDVSASGSQAVYSDSGKELFFIKENVLTKRTYSWYIVILEVVGVFLIFIVFNRRLRLALQNGWKVQALLNTSIYLVFIEVFINILHLPTFTAIGQIFQSESYASPFLASSLCGLLLRVHLLHWICRHWLKYFLSKKSTLTLTQKSFISTAYIVVSFYFVVFVVGSLHNNSIISFDLSKINQLDIESLIGILIICFSFGLAFIPINFLKKEYFNKTTYVLQLLLHAVLIVVGYLFGLFQTTSFILIIVAIYIVYQVFLLWLVSNLSVLQEHRLMVSLMLLSIYSLLGAISILYYSNLRKADIAELYALELTAERDYAEEFDLSMVASELNQDNFLKSYFENPYLISFDIDSRIKQKFFSKYLGSYKVAIHMFNQGGTHLKGEGTQSLHALQVAKNQSGVQSISDQLYYLSVKPKGEKYMIFTEYYKEDELLGYLVVVFTPKTLVSYSVYPELLRSDKEYSIHNQITDVTYAIYRNKKLIKVEGNYSYPISFKATKEEAKKFIREKENGFVHIMHSTNEKQVVVSYKQISVLGAFSYFSFILILLIVFFYLMSFVSRYGSFWLSDRRVRKSIKLDTFQKKIQFSMISQVLVSLVLIGSMTIFFFNVQYNRMHNESLKRRGHSIVEALEKTYIESISENSVDHLSEIFRNKIKQVSEIYTIDINAYDGNGRLMFSSQPEIFKNGLQSTIMNPKAYQVLKLNQLSSQIQNEWIGKLKYVAAYLPFNDANGNLLGYVHLPYYGKERNVRNDISFFLVSLVNIYVLLILGAAVLSVWVSRAIVRPLGIITESIKRVELGKKNVLIHWRNKDEIGELISEYNRMVNVLEESAELLAKSEREEAWREMAKQVAHEIKNPLTPMKLSIQYLQKALDDGRDDVEEMTRKIASRLIEEIDTLANIATAFSNFAKMPVGKPEHVDIVSVLISVIDLFENSNDIHIESNLPQHEVVAYVDKDQMMRVFTNLMKNAIQSIPDHEIGKIIISIDEKEDSFIVQVTDNGIGIPEDRTKIIFEPNFTTKSSGTGLGLAMCKSIIETSDGEIWLESNPNKKGTTFFVQLKKVF